MYKYIEYSKYYLFKLIYHYYIYFIKYHLKCILVNYFLDWNVVEIYIYIERIKKKSEECDFEIITTYYIRFIRKSLISSYLIPLLD